MIWDFLQKFGNIRYNFREKKRCSIECAHIKALFLHEGAIPWMEAFRPVGPARLTNYTGAERNFTDGESVGGLSLLEPWAHRGGRVGAPFKITVWVWAKKVDGVLRRGIWRTDAVISTVLREWGDWEGASASSSNREGFVICGNWRSSGISGLVVGPLIPTIGRVKFILLAVTPLLASFSVKRKKI